MEFIKPKLNNYDMIDEPNKSCSNCKYSTNIRIEKINNYTTWTCINSPFLSGSMEGKEYFISFNCSLWVHVLVISQE